MASTSSNEKSPSPPPLSAAPSLPTTTSPATTFLIAALGTPITTSSISVTLPTGQPFYTCTLQTISKPHVNITSSSTGAQVGTIIFHAFSRSMTLAVFKKDGGRDEIEISNKHVFKSGYQYQSPTLAAEVEWKSFGEGTSVLIDGSGTVVARFNNERWNAGKERTLEVVDVEGREDVVLEALVGAIAIMESRRRNAKNSIITAGVLGV
ncbi:MAG: hypothetical protein LQ349_004844 [Xanthoria aureola]|nr:MAG: hypothetical protein LQ349_004844 [Xanthoria aureola]